MFSALEKCGIKRNFGSRQKKTKRRASLFNLLPTGDEVPYYNTKVEAKKKLLKSVSFELQAQSQNGYKRNIQQVAEPMAQKLAILKPSFEE